MAQRDCYVLPFRASSLMSASEECGEWMSECERRIKQLREHLRHGASLQPLLPELLDHVTNCPHCQAAAHALVATLHSDQEDLLSCAEAEALLPAFSEAADPAAPQWDAIRRHLVSCGHCAADYLELLELARLDHEREVTISQPGLAPRLDFLPHRQAQATPAWQLDALGGRLISFSQELLATMLAAAPPAPALAVKHEAHAQVAGRLAFQDPAGELTVTLTLEARADAPELYTLTAEVRIASRGGWPNLAGSELRATLPGRAEEVRVTDAFGRASITPLTRDELAVLVLTIVPVT